MIFSQVEVIYIIKFVEIRVKLLFSRRIQYLQSNDKLAFSRVLKLSSLLRFSLAEDLKTHWGSRKKNPAKRRGF